MNLDPLAPKVIGLPPLERADKVLMPYMELGLNPWEPAFISAYEDLRASTSRIEFIGDSWDLLITSAKGSIGTLRLVGDLNGNLVASIV